MALLSFAGQDSRYFYPFDRSIDNPEGLLAVFDILISTLLNGHRPARRSRTTRTDGRSVGRAYGQVITKISRMGRFPNFLTRGAPLRPRGAPRKLLLRGFLVLFQYLVWFSLCSSLFTELRDNEVVKNLQFCP